VCGHREERKGFLMVVVDPGHEYLLTSLDGDQENRLVFVKREGIGYPGNVGHHPGTTMQEVLRALVERANYVNNQIRHEDTTTATELMMLAVYYLEKRAAERHGRNPPDMMDSVYGDTCQKCGHVGCNAACHKEKI
jgi:hypothetical protein